MSEIAVLLAGGLIAAIVSGATGFGFALTATAIWMQWLPPHVVAALAVLFALVLNIGYLPYFWRDIDWRRLWPFLVGGVVGVPLGAIALRDLAPSTLRMLVGIVLVLYSAYALLRGRLPTPRIAPERARTLDGGVGFAGGFFGGIGGLCGFLPALWSGLRGWSKHEQRGVVQAYILAMNVLSLAWIGGVVGLRGVGQYTLIALPVVAVGGVIGLKLFRRFDTAAFNRAVLWTLLGCGIVLVINSR